MIISKIDTNIKVEKMLKEYPHLKEKENILYVPTFRKGEKDKSKDLIDNVNKEKYKKTSLCEFFFVTLHFILTNKF